MKDALNDVVKYLAAVPRGRAVVSVGDAKTSLRHSGSAGSVENVKDWAALHGFKVTGDRPDLGASNIFYFRVKEAK